MDKSELLLKLQRRLLSEKKRHPSFLLMNGLATYDESLLPLGATVLNSSFEGISEGNKYNFHDFVQTVWQDNEAKVLYITGDGGVGKTVSLLEFATEGGICRKNIPAVYIPLFALNEFSGNDDCIRWYLKRKFRNLADEIENLAEEERTESIPKLVLLLDGANEVLSTKVGVVEESINRWAEYDGVFIVMTSRNGRTTVKNRIDFELQHINKKTAQLYLKTILQNSTVKVPHINSSIYSILDTPLMLNLYAQIELYKERTSSYSFLEWHPSDSAGNVIWNYLQKELYRCADQHSNTTTTSLPEYALAILYIAPYICYQMEKTGDYSITDSELRKLATEAYHYYCCSQTTPPAVKRAESFRAEALVWLDKNDPAFEQKILDLIWVLTNDAVLFKKKGRKHYVLMHQSFRDCLAAIHLNNLLSVQVTGLPCEYTEPLSLYVAGYLSEIISNRAFSEMWERNRKTIPTDYNATNNLLRVYSRRNNGDFKKLNWSGMDLREINLYSYKRAAENRLLISAKAEDYNGTKLSLDTFLPHGHTERVNCVVFSKDGKRAASAADDLTICIWDSLTHQQVGKPLCGHEACIHAVAFSKDGNVLASGDENGAIILWDLSTQKQINGNSYMGHAGAITALVFSNYKNRLISTSEDGTICIWDVETQKQIGKTLSGHKNRVNAVAISRNDKNLVTGSEDKTVRIWSTETYEQIGDPLFGHTDAVTCVAIDDDGKIASGSADRTIRIWDSQNNMQIGSPLLGHENCVSSIWLDKSGKRLISGSYDRTIRVWDTVNSKQIGETLTGHEDYIYSIDVTEDGSIAVSGAEDRTVRFWNLDTYQQEGEAIKKYAGALNSVCFLNRENIVATCADDGMLRLWSIEEQRQCDYAFYSNASPLNCVAATDDNTIIVCGSEDGCIYVWDREKRKLAGKPLHGHTGAVNSVAINNKTSQIISGSDDGTVRLWSLINLRQKKRSLNEHTSYVNSVAVSTKANRMISGSEDSTVLVWNASRLHAIGDPMIGQAEGVTTVAISSDGLKAVSGARDGNIRIWIVNAHHRYGTPLAGHNGQITSVAFSPKAALIFSGSADKTVRVWRTDNHIQVGEPLCGHTDCVNAIACNSAGTLIASVSEDGTIRFWNVKDHSPFGEPIRPLPGIDLFGFDFSKADISDHDKDVFRQNGVKI